jgi:hypothetical protein
MSGHDSLGKMCAGPCNTPSAEIQHSFHRWSRKSGLRGCLFRRWTIRLSRRMMHSRPQVAKAILQRARCCAAVNLRYAVLKLLHVRDNCASRTEESLLRMVSMTSYGRSLQVTVRDIAELPVYAHNNELVHLIRGKLAEDGFHDVIQQVAPAHAVVRYLGVGCTCPKAGESDVGLLVWLV